MAQQQQPYIYNRGREIRQDMGKAAQNIEQGFQNLIDYKQKEYDFINQQMADVELIKKDLNMYNNDIITKRSDELLKDTASAIKENGKLDFKKLGEIKRRTMDLATAKRNSELSVQAAGEVIKLLNQNAPNMRDVTGTYTKIMNSLKDEKNLFSPKDLYSDAMMQYRDGVDYIKVGQGRLNELIKNGHQVSAEPFTTSRGDLVSVSGALPKGVSFDPKTGKIVPNITPDVNGNNINPIEDIAKGLFSQEELEGYKKQLVGAGIMFNPDLTSHLSDFVTQSLMGSIQYKNISTAEDLAKKKADADVAGEKLNDLQYRNTDAYRKWEKDIKEQAAKNDTTRANAAVLGANASSMNASTNAAELSEKRKSGYFTKTTGASGNDNGSPVLDTAGTYSAPMKNSKGSEVIRVGKKGSAYYSVDKNNKAKGISEFEANYIINSLPKEERGAAKQALKGAGQQSVGAPKKVDVSNIFNTPK